MKKIKAFIYVFIKSISSPVYYNDVIKTSFAFSFKYYLSLGMLMALIVSTGITINFAPKINSEISNIVVQAKNFYPDDLVFSMKDGEWNINRPMPFIVPAPSGINLKELGEDGEDFPKNLIVFDKEGTINDLDTQQTLILVNNVNIITKENNAIKATPIKNIPNGEFTKSNFVELIDSVASYTKFLPAIIFGIVLIGVLAGYLVGRMLYLLAVGLLVFIVATLTGIKLTYVNSYKVALHTMTLPLVISVILTLLNLDIPVPLWFFILNSGLALVAIWAIKKEHATELATPQPLVKSPEEVDSVSEDISEDSVENEQPEDSTKDEETTTEDPEAEMAKEEHK